MEADVEHIDVLPVVLLKFKLPLLLIPIAAFYPTVFIMEPTTISLVFMLIPLDPVPHVNEFLLSEETIELPC